MNLKKNLKGYIRVINMIHSIVIRVFILMIVIYIL